MVPAGSTERKPDSEIVGCFQERVKGWGFPSLQGRCHLLSWWTEECPPGLRHLLEEQAWSSVRSQWGKWWGRVCFWCGRMDQSLYHSQEPPAWRSGWVLQPCTLQRSFLLVCVQIRVLERAPLKKKKKKQTAKYHLYFLSSALITQRTSGRSSDSQFCSGGHLQSQVLFLHLLV